MKIQFATANPIVHYFYYSNSMVFFIYLISGTITKTTKEEPVLFMTGP